MIAGGRKPLTEAGARGGGARQVTLGPGATPSAWDWRLLCGGSGVFREVLGALLRVCAAERAAESAAGVAQRLVRTEVASVGTGEGLVKSGGRRESKVLKGAS